MPRSIWEGALTLMLASLVTRALSFVYRLLVVRIVGPEGIGLYEMVFPFYTLVLVLATAGVPVALAKLTAERVALQKWEGVRSLLHVSITFLFFSGLCLAVALYLLGPRLTREVFADPRVYPLFMVMLIALPVVAVCSGLRGYFQGMQFMRPIALSQVSEQVIRITSGLALASLLLPRGIEYAAAGLAGGMVMGEIAGLIISLIVFFLVRPYWEIGTSRVSLLADVLPLARLAFPVTLARVADCSMWTLEALLIPHLLENAGLTLREATTNYGYYSGIALTLVQLPTIITIAVSTTMVPAIAEATAVKNLHLVHQRCSQALKLTIVTGLPFAISFYLFPTELCGLIFAVPEAGAPLRVLSWGCIFLYLQHSTSGILNGLGAMKATLKTILIGGVLIIMGIYLIVPLKGVTGAAMALNLGSIAAALLNMLFISGLTGYRLEPETIVFWPLLAGLAMAGSSYIFWLFMAHLPVIFRLGISIFAGGAVYLSILLAAGVIRWSYFTVVSWLRFKI